MKHYTAVFIVATLLAFLTVMQYRTAEASRAGADRTDAGLLAAADAHLYRGNRKLSADIASLEQQRAEMAQIANSSGTAESAVNTIVANFEALSGQSAASGPGIQLIAYRRLEQSELIDILNVLRGLGAEALAVNGERISLTAPLDASQFGDTITIEAIGQAQTLADGLKTKGGIIDQLRRGSPAEPTLTEAATLTVPALQTIPGQRELN